MKEILIIFVLILSTSLFAGTFEDDFSDGAADGWTFSGTRANLWTVTSGELNSNGTNHVGAIGFGLIDGITTPNSFVLEADIRLTGGGDFGHVGLAWGVHDTSNYNTAYLRTHSDHVTTFGIVNGGGAGESILGTPGTTNQVTYHMVVDVNYDTKVMVLSLDGFSTTFTGSAFDAMNRNSGGGLGVITWGEGVTYDNVVLTSDAIVSSVPEPSTWLGLSLAFLFALSRKARRE